jgi:hypothetical protein
MLTAMGFAPRSALPRAALVQFARPFFAPLKWTGASRSLFAVAFDIELAGMRWYRTARRFVAANW